MYITRQFFGWNVLPAFGAALHLNDIRHKWIEEPLPLRVCFDFFILVVQGADLLAHFNAQLDRVFPEHLPGTTLHHLRTHVE